MDLVQLAFGLVFLAFSLVVPGYCLTLAFFPKRSELDELERFAFSFVFSITFLPLIVLVENQLFGIPIDALSAILTLLVIMAAGLLVWKLRTHKMKKEEAVKIWLLQK